MFFFDLLSGRNDRKHFSSLSKRRSGETIHRKLGASRYDPARFDSRYVFLNFRFGLVYLNFVPLTPTMEKIKKRRNQKCIFFPSKCKIDFLRLKHGLFTPKMTFIYKNLVKINSIFRFRERRCLTKWRTVKLLMPPQISNQKFGNILVSRGSKIKMALKLWTKQILFVKFVRLRSPTEQATPQTPNTHLHFRENILNFKKNLRLANLKIVSHLSL